MKRYLLVGLIFIAGASAGQEIPIIKLTDLSQILTSNEKEIVIVNFWATWCAPCIKELPYFNAIENSKNERIKIYLISLDYAEKLEVVKNFVSRKKLNSTVMLLDELDYNSWINKVDSSWQGAIPATLIKNTKTGQRKFIAKELKEGELDAIIEELSKI
jgi:thiol-disulfide isomerase/thioredoxin